MKEIPVQELMLNPMMKIAKEWMLITAGNEARGYNTMTASWGHLGSIWGSPNRKGHIGLPTAVVYIRPQRYTKSFVDREDIFTLSVFDESYRKELAYLGTASGRDGDKIAQARLTPVFVDGTTAFAEAELTLVCRKIYRAPIVAEGFVDPSILDYNYPDRDLHDMYVGEILKV